MSVPTLSRVTTLRLRPVVHASPTAGGVHVRGWSSSFTCQGGPGLWRLWETLAGHLTAGTTAERLDALSGREAVRAAVATLLAQLHEHDMVVQVPPGWDDGPDAPPGEVARWLESSAPDPAAAWDRLRAAEVTVTGGGRLAAAAVRALAAGGVTPSVRGGDRDRVVLAAAGVTVVAGADADTGFAAAPATADPEAVARRLGLGTGTDAETPVLAALVGGVAAHRLLCALAGLPDPGPAGHPTVFVARLDPLRGTYHPWAGSTVEHPADDSTTDGGTDGGRLDRAIATVDVLTDPELGPLGPVRLADLPQLPAGLAAVDGPDGPVAGTAATVDVARLLAVLGAVEQGAGPAVAVGADRRHADGVALRRLAHRDHLRPVPGDVALDGLVPGGPVRLGAGGRVLDDRAWTGSPVARQWWKALTLRFGLDARVVLTRLADGVHHAQVSVAGRAVSWAVEAAAADAAAFALLAAVGAQQWTQAGGGTAVCAPCGATPAPPLADRTRVPWQSGAWAWPAPLADAEPALQHRLRRLVGATPRPVPAPGGLCAVVVSR